MELKSRILHALRWSILSKGAAQLVSWCITIVVIRILTPEDYGLMAIALIFVNLTFMLNEIGLGAALVQMEKLEDELVRKIYSFILVINAIFFMLLFLAAPWIADFFDEPRVTLLIRVLSFQFLLSAFELVPMALLERDLKLKQKAFAQLAGQMAGGLTALSMALTGFGVWSLVAGALVDGAVRAVGMNVAHYYIRLPSTSFSGISEAMRFGGYVTGERFLWFVYNQADIFIIGKLLGKVPLGIYSIAMQLSTMPMTKTGEIIYTVAFPAFSRVQTNRDEMRTYFLKALRLMAFLVFPAFWGMAAVSQEIVDVFLGSQWVEAGWIMQLLCLMMPLRMLSNLLPPVLQAVGRPDISFMNLLIATLVMPVAFLVGVRWGLQGVCLAWVSIFPAVVAIMLWRSMSVLGIRPWRLAREVIWPIINAALMFVGVLLVKAALPAMATSLSLLLMVLIGAIVYLAATLITTRADLKEFVGLVRSI